MQPTTIHFPSSGELQCDFAALGLPDLAGSRPFVFLSSKTIPLVASAKVEVIADCLYLEAQFYKLKELDTLPGEITFRASGFYDNEVSFIFSELSAATLSLWSPGDITQAYTAKPLAFTIRYKQRGQLARQVTLL